MTIAEQVAYLNKDIQAGEIILLGRPVQVQGYDGAPGKTIQKVALVYGKHRHEFAMKSFDDSLCDPIAVMDAFVDRTNHLLDMWDEDE